MESLGRTVYPCTSMAEENSIFKVGFINIRGQTGLSSAKQTQIESFLIHHKLDVLHLQEINICDDSFSTCNLISSSYNLLSNNSPTKYGTSSLVKSDFTPENILMDTNGRCIVFKCWSTNFSQSLPSLWYRLQLKIQ